MRIYIKEGKLYIANIGNRDELIIKSDNDITSLDVDFIDGGWNGVEATAWGIIGDEIEGVKI